MGGSDWRERKIKERGRERGGDGVYYIIFIDIR